MVLAACIKGFFANILNHIQTVIVHYVQSRFFLHPMESNSKKKVPALQNIKHDSDDMPV